MNTETILNYIELYGYFIIFLFLFFGIVGIPAPEESLLFLIGLLIAQKKLSLIFALMSAVLGAFIGMLTAYFCGIFLGSTMISRYGKYVGITEKRLEKVKNKYKKNVRKTIVFGFYMPGIRQISPYFAGFAKIPFRDFLLLSFIGTVLWTLPIISVGYFAGTFFNISPQYVSYLGLVFLIVFLIYVSFKYLKKKKGKVQV